MKIPEGIEIKGYVPELYRHFAASDLAIVQGGGTTTIELTALRKPFLFFPLEGHFEQQVHVTNRLKRHRAGIKMTFKDTNAIILAKTVLSNIGKNIGYYYPLCKFL